MKQASVARSIRCCIEAGGSALSPAFRSKAFSRVAASRCQRVTQIFTSGRRLRPFPLPCTNEINRPPTTTTTRDDVMALSSVTTVVTWTLETDGETDQLLRSAEAIINRAIRKAIVGLLTIGPWINHEINNQTQLFWKRKIIALYYCLFLHTIHNSPRLLINTFIFKNRTHEAEVGLVD